MREVPSKKVGQVATKGRWKENKNKTKQKYMRTARDNKINLTITFKQTTSRRKFFDKISRKLIANLEKLANNKQVLQKNKRT